jgi:putative CocE/NonD family hydrolase
MGPWRHSQINGKAWELGPFKWEGDTADQYRRNMVMPFFIEHLRGGPPAKLARVAVYNTAENHWEYFQDWPTACKSGCPTKLTPIYLRENFTLGFERPKEAKADGDTYVSDPAKPVPFLPRPIMDPFYGYGSTSIGYVPWAKWLIWDQRFVDGRTDVLSYETEPLGEQVRVQGVPAADIRAMTTGTDGDFVVKLIDVYPSDFPSDPTMGGYQLPIALSMFRGRYRDSFEHPTAIPKSKAQSYNFELPNVNHVFLPGHRIMVQIQSTLFPLYDRNPQTFVPNIFNAQPADYQKASVTILRSNSQPSAVWLPVVGK